MFVSDDEKFEIKTVDGEEGIYFTKKEDPSSGGQNPINPEPSNPEQPTNQEPTNPEQKEEVSTTVTETAGESLVSPKTADCNTIFACTVLIVDMLLASVYFYKKSKRQ